MEYDLHHGDCLQVLASLDDNSVDAVVTDPPYGIGFMGKEWDSFSPETTGKIRAKDVEKDTDNPNLKGRKSPSFGAAVHYDKGADANYRYQMWTHRWAEAIKRVLKPGGHMLVCMGSRTAHRVTCGIEDAGFEIRHVMPWLFWLYGKGMPKSKWLDADKTIGTGLKPMYEPILMARKPCGGIATACYVEHGTGGLNIDACRVDGGRWAPDVMLDEDAAAMLDEATGHLQAGHFPAKRNVAKSSSIVFAGRRMLHDNMPPERLMDAGGASRFFYCAKTSTKEREAGCDHLPLKTAGELTGGRKEGSLGLDNPRAGAGHRSTGRRNHHPTVKPIAVMQWLVRLVTPPGGAVLDPFMGSGSTGIACVHENRSFIGIDKEFEYVEIADARIEYAKRETS